MTRRVVTIVLVAAPGAKYVTAWTGSNRVHIDRAADAASATTVLLPGSPPAAG
jgi:hypothetical protein